jgi:hypothetical protein
LKEDIMRSRLFLGSTLMVAILAAGTVATSGDSVGSSRQWAAAFLTEPTLIGSTIVQGPVLFVHDDARMARGEPCTSVQLFNPGEGPAEEIASFHCTPRARAAVRTFTIRTRPNTEYGFGCVLTEYQFAGDTEAHGVPAPAAAH